MNKEIVLQVYNNPDNDVVTFTVSPVGTSYKFNLYNCYYLNEQMNSVVHEITGDHIGEDYWLAIDNIANIHQDENLKFLWSLLQIRIEVGYGYPSSTNYTNYFYWDVRDCNFYTPCNNVTCDITLRYDRTNNNIWFYQGLNKINEDPSNSEDWELVNNQTKNYWDVKNIPHCPLDFTPSNFNLTGNVGQHPILTWENNSPFDIAGYKIYVNYNNTGYSLLYTITDPSITTFIDNGITITGGKFDPTVCYKISAYNIENYESNKTDPKCTKSSSINKSAENDENLEENLVNNIKVYPNPFNPKTNIMVSVAEKGNVLVEIYNLLGEQEKILMDEFKEKGNYHISFDGSNLTSGMYIVTFKINNYFESQIISLIK